jgi:hypothetical protein
LQHYLALTPRNGKYTATLADARRRFEDTFRAITVGYHHSGLVIL